MTVSTTTSRSGPYAGAGTTGPFTVGFRFLDNSHLLVVRADSLGVETTLVLNTDYTVTGAGSDVGGVVTLVVALAVGYTLTIQRNVPLTQLLDYTQSDAFPAESHESGLDKLTMALQQVDTKANGAIRVPEVAGVPLLPSAASRAGTVLAFDALGNPALVVAQTGTFTYGQTVIDSFTGDAATTLFTLSTVPGLQSDLLVSVGGVVQDNGVDFAWTTGKTLAFASAPPLGMAIRARYVRSLPMGTSDAAVTTFSPSAPGVFGTAGYELGRHVWADLSTGYSGSVNAANLLAAAVRCQAAGGGTVLMPPGDFPFANAVWDASLYPLVSLRGSGKKATILRESTGSSAPVLEITSGSLVPGALLQWFNTISDFSIVGNAFQSPGLRTTLIAIFTVRNLGFSACSIGWSNVGSLIATVSDTDFRGNAVGYRAVRSGTTIYPNLITFSGGQCIGNTSIGFDIVHGHGITWDHVDIEMNGVSADATTGGVFIRSTTNLEIAYGTFSFDNCWFEQNAGPNLTVEAAAGILLTVKDTKFIRAILANSAVAMTIGAIECANLYNNFALSGLAGNLSTTIAASRSNVEGGLYGILTNTSTGYQHRQVGTSIAFIPFLAGDSSGNATTIGPTSADFPNAAEGNIGGTKVTKRYTIPALSNVTTTIPVATVAQVGGVMAFVRGADNATGIAYARIYVVAVKIGGGGGSDVVQASGTFAGSATPTFTFSNNGGFLRVANDNANAAFVSFLAA